MNQWKEQTSIFRYKNKDKIYDFVVLGYIESYKNVLRIRTNDFSLVVFREATTEE
ncbi:hypothetical protein [Mycoplasma zalophi]|uniref:hypothetical protein n=1 Tax=Mycoplasma zalophi TaxID=191287 RepID=UPI001C128123|nr:hypothetical protein [Mycoplasma zalophi]MBU4690842.1 hypothetical protein [Mycoplasma zalophi]